MNSEKKPLLYTLGMAAATIVILLMIAVLAVGLEFAIWSMLKVFVMIANLIDNPDIMIALSGAIAAVVAIAMYGRQALRDK